MTFPMISTRVFGTPLLVDPAKGAAFLAGLGPRLVNGTLTLRGLEGMSEDRVARAGRIRERASIIADDVGARARVNGRRLYAVRDGVAIIEVTGTLVHRGEWVGESSGTTSYEGLTAQVVAAAADPNVRGIALEVDSFGGEVAGAFDLADTVRAARARKPVWAFVAEAALSGGYVLASQADRIIVPRTGEVGSIGVLTIHADYSQRLADEGVAVTMIYAGRHKVDANPYEQLPEDVRDALQARVERTRQLFAETVAAGRGARLTVQAALATEAQVYQGADAVEAGLADEVADPRSAFEAFVAEIARPRSASPTAVAAAAKQGTNTMNHIESATPEAQDVDEATQDTKTDTTAPETPSATTNAATATTAAAEATISRAQAAELAEVAQQASRLGVSVDLADAIQQGLSADRVRQNVLAQLATKSVDVDVVAVTPAAATASRKESPIVAAAKRTAEQQRASAQRH